jgi:hypothetical protein
MSAIQLVAGDTLPFIELWLVNADGTAMNVANATVEIQFRALGVEPVLSVIPCTLPNGGGDGLIQFNFPAPALAVPPGNYEGAVQINYGGDLQTLWGTIPFVVRASF